MAINFSKFDQFSEDVAHKVHDLGSDQLRFYLTNATPSAAADAVLLDLYPIANGNGYTGPVALVRDTSLQTSGVYKLVLDDPTTITATGGAIPPFRYVVIYNDTPTSPADPLIGWFDYGSQINLAETQTFDIDLSAANGLLTIA